MLSYRHAYHAGNFADVMKHVVLTSLLKYMTRKDAGLCFIDTHAGAGSYDLQSARAHKTAESVLGISKLWDADDAPEPVRDYLELVHRHNPAGSREKYPGSPWIAATLLRAQDRLMLCELHSADFSQLQSMFANDRRVHCYEEDGYRFSAGLLPPIERRGLILMDPSYELRTEYVTALTTIGTLLRRFATGTYALWHPILDERRSAAFRSRVEEMGLRNVLHLALRIAGRKGFPGMYGCGVVVINPPWTLRGTMEVALPWLVAKLGVNADAAWAVEQWVDE